MKTWSGRLVALTLLACPALGQAQRQRFSNLDDAQQASVILAGRGMPRGLTWLGNGDRYAFITGAAQSTSQEIRVYDFATGKDSVLVPAQPLAFRTVQYSGDAKTLLFQSNFRPIYRASGLADYHLYTVGDRRLRLASRDARSAELSPNARSLGLERSGDLFVVDVATGRERRLTRDASAHVFNGHWDWVYEEEFGLTQAWTWSPDSKRIAFWQVDERAVPETRITDYRGSHPTWTSIRYAKAGDANAKVRIGVVDVASGSSEASGRTVWLDPGVRGDYYIPRVYWTTRPDTLAMVVLDRRQQVMTLFFFDVRTGGRRQVMRETSSSWVEVFAFFGGVDQMSFPKTGHEFLWMSDRDGFTHIYRYDYSGKLVQQVTRGPWNVVRIAGIDAPKQLIYFIATNPSPLERQLWRVRFDGTELTRVTTSGGTHTVSMSPDARSFLDAWSSTRSPRQLDAWSTDRGKLRVIEANTGATQWLGSHEYSPTTFFSVTTADGVRLDASMIRPVPFDSTRRYPVIFNIYGGAGSQGVTDAFSTNAWNQWLASQGYIVVDVNSRGSGGYSADFTKVVYRQLGRYETDDYAAVAKHLGALPYVDANRIGIMGTSNGGYLTMYAMVRHPEIFRAGIANSGVADWRLYDTIITERLMGLPDENADGYSQSSVLTHADKLAGRLLLVHSMMDDNVHPDNTMQALTAFSERGKDVELRLYPLGRHGAAYNATTTRLMREAQFEFLSRALAPSDAGVRPPR